MALNFLEADEPPLFRAGLSWREVFQLIQSSLIIRDQIKECQSHTLLKIYFGLGWTAFIEIVFVIKIQNKLSLCSYIYIYLYITASKLFLRKLIEKYC